MYPAFGLPKKYLTQRMTFSAAPWSLPPNEFNSPDISQYTGCPFPATAQLLHPSLSCIMLLLCSFSCVTRSCAFWPLTMLAPPHLTAPCTVLIPPFPLLRSVFHSSVCHYTPGCLFEQIWQRTGEGGSNCLGAQTESSWRVTTLNDHAH